MRILKRSALTLLAVITTLALVVGGYVLYMQHQYYRIPNHQKLTIGNNQAATLLPIKRSFYEPTRQCQPPRPKGRGL